MVQKFLKTDHRHKFVMLAQQLASEEPVEVTRVHQSEKQAILSCSRPEIHL